MQLDSKGPVQAGGELLGLITPEPRSLGTPPMRWQLVAESVGTLRFVDFSYRERKRQLVRLRLFFHRPALVRERPVGKVYEGASVR